MENEKSAFDADIKGTEKSIEKYLAKGSGSTIIITKNDSIRRRVAQILKRIEENKSVLVASKSSGISKAISIVEIVKQNQNLQQYNKINRITSEVNPNHKSRKIEQQAEVDPIKEATDNVRGPKVYVLPVMYTLLLATKKTLNGWTAQETA